MGGICRRHRRDKISIVVGKPLGRLSSKWEDNIKIDLREMWEGLDWIHLAQDMDQWRAVVETVVNLRDA
jgi:hypothetical protein